MKKECEGTVTCDVTKVVDEKGISYECEKCGLTTEPCNEDNDAKMLWNTNNLKVKESKVVKKEVKTDVKTESEAEGKIEIKSEVEENPQAKTEVKSDTKTVSKAKDSKSK